MPTTSSPPWSTQVQDEEDAQSIFKPSGRIARTPITEHTNPVAQAAPEKPSSKATLGEKIHACPLDFMLNETNSSNKSNRMKTLLRTAIGMIKRTKDKAEHPKHIRKTPRSQKGGNGRI